DNDFAPEGDGRGHYSRRPLRADCGAWPAGNASLGIDDGPAPAVRFGPLDGRSSLRLAITPDRRRAFVRFWGSSTSVGNFTLAVVDLETLLPPSSAPTADLALLAELATARRIELGDLSGLTTDQWLEPWTPLRERNADLARSLMTGPRSTKE